MTFVRKLFKRVSSAGASAASVAPDVCSVAPVVAPVAASVAPVVTSVLAAAALDAEESVAPVPTWVVPVVSSTVTSPVALVSTDRPLLAPRIFSNLNGWNVCHMSLDYMPDDFLDRMDVEDVVSSPAPALSLDIGRPFDPLSSPEFLAASLDRTDRPHRLHVPVQVVSVEPLSEEAQIMSAITMVRTPPPPPLELAAEPLVPFHTDVLWAIRDAGLGGNDAGPCCVQCASAGARYGVAMAHQCQRFA